MDDWLGFRGEHFVIMGWPPTHSLTIRDSGVVASTEFNTWLSGTTKATRLALRLVWGGFPKELGEDATAPWPAPQAATGRPGSPVTLDAVAPAIASGNREAPLQAGLPDPDVPP